MLFEKVEIGAMSRNKVSEVLGKFRVINMRAPFKYQHQFNGTTLTYFK